MRLMHFTDAQTIPKVLMIPGRFLTCCFKTESKLKHTNTQAKTIKPL